MLNIVFVQLAFLCRNRVCTFSEAYVFDFDYDFFFFVSSVFDNYSLTNSQRLSFSNSIIVFLL